MSGLGLGMGQRMDYRQEQKLSRRMILSMKVLLLPITDLLDRVQEELQENPFLEQNDTRPVEVEIPEGGEVEFNPDGILKHDESGDAEFARLDELNADWSDHFDAENRPSRGAIDDLGERKLDVMQNIAESPLSLHEHLAEQLGFLELTKPESDLVRFVISHLDDNGYLLRHDPDSPKQLQPFSTEELTQSYAKREVAPDEMESAIRVVQSLDPAGVGARDVKECLILQVTDETPHADLVRALIRNHLEDVAYNRLPLVQKRTGFSLDAIQEAIDELRKLDPKPGGVFAADNTRYIVPDIIVERTDTDEFDIRLTDDWLPSVRLSKRYIGVVKDRSQPKAARDTLKEKLQAANWLLSAIEQRRATLIKVTRAIINHQREFLDKGPEFIHPLKMEQIAELVGVHVTTVSRAVDDKWVQTPRGLFPLRRFFGGGTTNQQTGEDVAWETIRRKLLEIIAAEDKKAPLSDEDIMAKFIEAGLKIARRTVTKYREALKIPSSRQRREWTGE